jgi:hypothetical protein
MVVVFYLQNGNKGINERSELPPTEDETEVKVKVKVKVKVITMAQYLIQINVS